MQFNIDKAIKDILDDELPPRRRALRLFELLVAIYLCYGHAEPARDAAGDPFVIDVWEGDLRAARLLAANRFMQDIEKEVRAARPEAKDVLRACARNGEFAYLYNRVFLKGGGWRADRRRPSSSRFSKDLENAVVAARRLAAVLSVSVGFEPDPARPRLKGGIAMAQALAPDMDHLKGDLDVGETAIKEYWGRLGPVAAWVYLAQRTPFRMEPPLPKQAGFTAALLRLAGDRDRLVHFFGAYEAVRERLAGRNYDLHRIAPGIDLPAVEVPFETLPADARELVRTYKGR